MNTRRVGVVFVLSAALGSGACHPHNNNMTTPTPTLTAVTVNPSTVVGGTASNGTVTLSGSAPSGGAGVALASSDSSAATVPTSVVVPTGSTSAGFSITTSVVAAAKSPVITGTYSGVSHTATLTVNPQPLTAVFTVASRSSVTLTNGQVLPAGTADTCPLTTANGTTLDCTFDGSASTGGVTQWLWTYLFGSQQRSENSGTPTLQPTASGCGFFSGRTASSSGGVSFLQMIVQLQVRDSAGNLSGVVQDQNVRVFPNHLCGYGF